MLRQALRRIARPVAVALVAIMGLAAWDNCIGKGWSLRAQMACCAADDHDCPADEAIKCCEVKQPLKDRLILTELAVAVAPLVPLAMPVAAFATTDSARPWSDARAYGDSLRHLRGTPTYILTGSLLI